MHSRRDLTTNGCIVGRYTGVPYNQRAMRVQLGDTLLMDKGQPLDFDAVAASKYLTETTAVHGTVRHQYSSAHPVTDAPRPWLFGQSAEHHNITPRIVSATLCIEACANVVVCISVGFYASQVAIEVSIGDGPGVGMAWGCDLSYDYVKINAEYTT